jgi:hypothetical protein
LEKLKEAVKAFTKRKTTHYDLNLDEEGAEEDA